MHASQLCMPAQAQVKDPTSMQGWWIAFSRTEDIKIQSFSWNGQEDTLELGLTRGSSQKV